MSEILLFQLHLITIYFIILFTTLAFDLYRIGFVLYLEKKKNNYLFLALKFYFYK